MELSETRTSSGLCISVTEAEVTLTHPLTHFEPFLKSLSRVPFSFSCRAVFPLNLCKMVSFVLLKCHVIMVLVCGGLFSPLIISSILIIPSNSFVICIFGMQVVSKSLMKRLTTWGLEQMGSVLGVQSVSSWLVLIHFAARFGPRCSELPYPPAAHVFLFYPQDLDPDTLRPQHSCILWYMYVHMYVFIWYVTYTIYKYHVNMYAYYI